MQSKHKAACAKACGGTSVYRRVHRHVHVAVHRHVRKQGTYVRMHGYRRVPNVSKICAHVYVYTHPYTCLDTCLHHMSRQTSGRHAYTLPNVNCPCIHEQKNHVLRRISLHTPRHTSRHKFLGTCLCACLRTCLCACLYTWSCLCACLCTCPRTAPSILYAAVKQAQPRGTRLRACV